MTLSPAGCASSLFSTQPQAFGQCHLIVGPVMLLYKFVTHVVPQGLSIETEVEQGSGQKRQGACAHPELQAADPPFMEPCLGDAIIVENLCQGKVPMLIKVCSLGSLIA